MALITITPPAVEPLSLPQIREYLRQDFSDEDGTMNACIRAARQRVESFTRRRLITQVVEYRRDGLGGTIRLPVAPVVAVTEITYLDSGGQKQVLSSDLWRVRNSVSPVQVIPGHLATWPSVLPDLDTVGITMTVGYGDTGADVPGDILMAISGLAAVYYDHRPATGDMPAAVRDLIEPYVLWV